jgi:hypothetical protein
LYPAELIVPNTSGPDPVAEFPAMMEFSIVTVPAPA